MKGVTKMREFGWWILDDEHIPQFVGAGMTAAFDYDTQVWTRVADDWVGPYRISTVFLGIDLGFTTGVPMLFETMVFCGGSHQDLECARYPTWDAALQGHQAMLEEVRSWGWRRRIKDQWEDVYGRLKLYWRFLLRHVGKALGR